MQASQQTNDAAAAAPFERRLPAVPASVTELRSALTEWLGPMALDRQVTDAVRLTVTEAAANAVVHGFVDRDTGTIAVAAEPADDALVVRVTDDGRGLGPRHDSPGMGMGLPLIGKLTAHVDLSEGPDGVGTEVRMTFAAPGLRSLRPTPPTGGLDDVFADLARLGTGEGFAGEDVGTLAALVVPRLADVCTITLLDADGIPRRIGAAVARPDGTRDHEAEAWMLRFPPTSPDAPSQRAAASGDVQVVEVTRDWVDAVSPDADRADLLADLDLAWWAAVPLCSGDTPVGSVAVAGRAARGHAAPVVEATEQICRRAGGLVAAARLVDDLRRTRRRFERILGALAEAVTVSGSEGRVVYANDAAVELFGATTLEEVLTTPSVELAGRFDITRESGERVRFEDLPHVRVLAGEDEATLLTRSVHRSSGRSRWLLTTSRRLDDEGPLAVNVIRDITAQKEGERRQRFLADVGEALASSVDLEETFRAIARTAVPTLADWCAVDVLGEDGRLERVALTHVDPDKVALGWEIHSRYPPDLDDPVGIGAVLASGVAQTFADVTDEVLQVSAQDEEHLELLRSIGCRSALLLPMVTEDRTFGVLTLVTAESQRAFTSDAAELAADVARRGAVAIDAARLRAAR